MKLVILFVVIFDIMVLFYPSASPFFIYESQELAEPAPKPEKTRSDFAVNEIQFNITDECARSEG